MQAMVLCDIGKLELLSVAPPIVGTHDIKVRVSAVGVCGTDFNIFHGQANYNIDKLRKAIPLIEQPQILGHEIVGVVEEVGRQVEDLHVGDRVVLDQGLNCISNSYQPLCEYCASGNSHQCQYYREHGYSHAGVNLNVLNNLQFIEARLVFATGASCVDLIVLGHLSNTTRDSLQT